MSQVEYRVCEKMIARASFGLNKYGVSVKNAPLTKLQWLIHAQEEAMDLAVYLQKLIDLETEEE